MVSGELLAVGGEPRLNLKLHDTHTSELLKGVTVYGTGIKAIESGLRTKVDALLDGLVTDTGQDRAERPTTGEVFLSVSSSDATVQIDGGSASALGKGGQKLFTLPLGRHRVRVRREGFQDIEREVLIQPGAPFSLKETLLVPPSPMAVQPGSAYLSIDSAPQGARVFLDGADTRKDTPANFRDLAPGTSSCSAYRSTSTSARA